jgi:hypothetical protein
MAAQAFAGGSDVGIFKYERVLQLYDIVSQLSEQCFDTLRRAATRRCNEVGNPAALHRYFMLGLRSIEQWGYELQEQEAKEASDRFVQLQPLFEYAVVAYVREMYQDSPEIRVEIRLPPLSAFLHAVYKRLARTPEIISMSWWSQRCDSLHKRRIVMDTMRFSLGDVLANHITQSVVSTWLNENPNATQPTTVAPPAHAAVAPLQESGHASAAHASGYVADLPPDDQPWQGVSAPSFEPNLDGVESRSERRHSDRHSDRRSDRHSDRRSDRHSDRHSDRRSDRHRDRHSDRHSDRNGDTGRATGRGKKGVSDFDAVTKRGDDSDSRDRRTTRR